MNLKASPLRLLCATACVLSVAAALPGTVGSPSAAPSMPLDTSSLVLIEATPVAFVGPIPTEANPIRGVARLAKMRREGHLPDTFVRGGCTYNLAGDPEVAYYVKSC